MQFFLRTQFSPASVICVKGQPFPLCLSLRYRWTSSVAQQSEGHRFTLCRILEALHPHHSLPSLSSLEAHVFDLCCMHREHRWRCLFSNSVVCTTLGENLDSVSCCTLNMRCSFLVDPGCLRHNISSLVPACLDIDFVWNQYFGTRKQSIGFRWCFPELWRLAVFVWWQVGYMT